MTLLSWAGGGKGIPSKIASNNNPQIENSLQFH